MSKGNLYHINEAMFTKWLKLKNKHKITDVMIANHLNVGRSTINRVFNNQEARKVIKIKIDDYLSNFSKLVLESKCEVLTDNN